MPRSNRYIQPGYVYHLTHRCHDRKFLLRNALDRTEYCRRLRDAVLEGHISLFDFCVTCNHVHMIGMCDRMHDLSLFMKMLEGGFADYYNRRKGRSGSVWGGRFHSTMIEGGEHLWNCLRYADLNMVRAGVVNHPGEWQWCGYRELVGERKRYRILDIDRLIEVAEVQSRKSFIEIHKNRITERIRDQHMIREGVWTESIAVGSERFLQEIASKNKWRVRIHSGITEDGVCYIRENFLEYSILAS